MKRKRDTNEQIAFALRQAEGGTAGEEICRKLGASEATFSRWKRKFAGMGVSEIWRLKQQRGGYAKLKCEPVPKWDPRQKRNRGKTPGGALQAGFPGQRTRSGRRGMCGCAGTASLLPR